MPPLPKKKHSRARRGGRAAHSRIAPPPVSTCPECNAAKLPHRMCKACGVYNGRQISRMDGEDE